MLTEQQEKYLAKIPKGKMANIKPWDPKASEFARNLVKEMEKNSGLEVFWEGSLSLGIRGENDIDLYIFSEPKYFDKHIPSIVRSLGDPTYVLREKVLWRVKKGGHKVDASLISKNSPSVKQDKLFHSSLRKNPDLMKEYEALKTPGLSAREYYKRKNEFYNRVTKVE